MLLTKLSLARNNLINPGQEGALFSDIPAGDGKNNCLFLQCRYSYNDVYEKHKKAGKLSTNFGQ